MDWLDRFGEAGKIMALELKLILRNKRSKAYFWMSLLFLLYPLLFIGDEYFDSAYFLILMGVLVTGMMALNHGQLMLSWNSPHFDLLLTRRTKIEDIFKAKYYLLALSCLLMFILSLPYFFLNKEMVLFNLIMMLFHVGVSIFLYMFLASYNSKRIDPAEGGAFSFSGFGAAHYLIMIPIIGIPIMLYGLGYLIAGKSAGILLIALVGLIGFAFHKSIIRFCTNNFMLNRYKISAAFRNK